MFNNVPLEHIENNFKCIGKRITSKHLLASLIKNRESDVLRKRDSVLLSTGRIVTHRRANNMLMFIINITEFENKLAKYQTN